MRFSKGRRRRNPENANLFSRSDHGAGSPEGANAYRVFRAAAVLAAEAIAIGSDLRRLHRTDARHFDDIVLFWSRLRDSANCAALACAGGKQCSYTDSFVKSMPVSFPHWHGLHWHGQRADGFQPVAFLPDVLRMEFENAARHSEKQSDPPVGTQKPLAGMVGRITAGGQSQPLC